MGRNEQGAKVAQVKRSVQRRGQHSRWQKMAQRSTAQGVIQVSGQPWWRDAVGRLGGPDLLCKSACSCSCWAMLLA